jgi:hypothetical protein
MLKPAAPSSQSRRALTEPSFNSLIGCANANYYLIYLWTSKPLFFGSDNLIVSANPSL